MRVNRTSMMLAGLLLAVFGAPGNAVSAGPGKAIRLAEMDGGGSDVNIDLAVRQVTVAPVRAYVGDKIHVEMLVENKAEGKDTSNADLYANGKRVGRQLFSWGDSPGERLYRLSFDWDTRDLPPGEYQDPGRSFRLGRHFAVRQRPHGEATGGSGPTGGGIPRGGARGGERDGNGSSFCCEELVGWMRRVAYSGTMT